MGPQRSVAAVVAAGFAVIIAVIVVAWVAMQPRDERAAKAAPRAAATEVGAPTRIDDSVPIEAFIVQDDVPAGTSLSRALDQKLVVTTQIPLELMPRDAITVKGDLSGLTMANGLKAGVVLTSAALAPPKVTSPASNAECPKDWQGAVAPDDRLVFVVTKPVTTGTTVAQAFADGALQPRLLTATYAPPMAAGALAPICLSRATFDLTPGAVVMPSTFAPV